MLKAMYLRHAGDEKWRQAELNTGTMKYLHVDTCEA